MHSPAPRADNTTPTITMANVPPAAAAAAMDEDETRSLPYSLLLPHAPAPLPDCAVPPWLLGQGNQGRTAPVPTGFLENHTGIAPEKDPGFFSKHSVSFFLVLGWILRYPIGSRLQQRTGRDTVTVCPYRHPPLPSPPTPSPAGGGVELQQALLNLERERITRLVLQQAWGRGEGRAQGARHKEKQTRRGERSFSQKTKEKMNGMEVRDFLDQNLNFHLGSKIRPFFQNRNLWKKTRPADFYSKGPFSWMTRKTRVKISAPRPELPNYFRDRWYPTPVRRLIGGFMSPPRSRTQ